MTTLATLLTETSSRLEAVSNTPRLDAELLLAHALGMERSAMLPRLRDLAAPGDFEMLIERRLKHEPVAYIRGYQEFWDLVLRVTPDVLIPRSDSETLIEAALAHFTETAPQNILDLGTGSGALLLAALSAFPSARGTAIDASEAALAVAADNAGQLGFAGRSRFLHRNWHGRGWAKDLGTFNLILCNPPYVESGAKLSPQVSAYEPKSALFAGIDGLDEYKILIPQLDGLLARGGIALFEIGKGQEAVVAELAALAGFGVEEHFDLAGIIRALCLSKPG